MRSPLPFTEIASLRVSQSRGKWTENLKIQTLAEHYVRTLPDKVFRNRVGKINQKGLRRQFSALSQNTSTGLRGI